MIRVELKAGQVQTGRGMAKKPPVIRKGNKKPYIKCTKLEFEHRVESAYILLGQDCTDGQIHTIFENDYNLSHRQRGVYIAQARARRIAETGKTKVQHVEDAYHRYMAILRDPASKSSDRNMANRGIVDLFGLEAPKRHELTGADGGPIKTKEENPLAGLPVERLRELASLDLMGRNGH